MYPFQEIEIIISEEYTIISDNFLLKQLLINLIENAVKYGNKKRVHYHCRQRGISEIDEVYQSGRSRGIYYSIYSIGYEVFA